MVKGKKKPDRGSPEWASFAAAALRGILSGRLRFKKRWVPDTNPGSCCGTAAHWSTYELGEEAVAELAAKQADAMWVASRNET